MFAFSFWDKRERKLLLVRDRYGIKPLYWTQQGRTFLFGSEVKAILAHPGYRISLDKEALLEYFTFQNFFTDRTLFADVRLLPAGVLMRIDADSGSVTSKRYWDFHFEEAAAPLGKEEYVEEFDRLFRQTVNRQFVSDVDVGAYFQVV